MSESGSVVWPSLAEPIWRLNWRLADSPDQEGTVITNARFRDRQVFFKASLPSLRVQYDSSCGPYKDPLNYNNAKPTSSCPSTRVCLYSYTSNGLRGLGVDSYHEISAYRLTHRWVFWENGVVYPRIYSAGLYCNYNHRHHAYWRFDFDIEGASNDIAFEYNTTTPNIGWGPGWHVKSPEMSRVKNASSLRSWAVMDKGSGRGYHIISGPNDGLADSFAPRDLWVMRYYAAEDKHGNQGNANNDDLQAYLSGENTDGQDDVIWYCAHLFHDASEPSNDWHGAGPNLIPFGAW